MKIHYDNGILEYWNDGEQPIAIPDYLSHTPCFFSGIENVPAEDVRTIILHEGITRIGVDAFFGACVEELYIPDGVTEIASHAIRNCPNLHTVSLPSSLERIGTYAFERCPNLRTIEFRGGANKGLKIGSNVFACNLNAHNVLTLFDLHTDDGFLAYLFKKYCFDTSSLHMKRDVLTAWLSGRPAAGVFQKALVRYAKASSDSLTPYYLKTKDVPLIQAYLTLFVKDKNAAAFIEQVIEQAHRLNDPALTTALLTFRQQHVKSGGSYTV